MTLPVNWEQLARQLGAIQENTTLGPYSERGGIEIARLALVTILGDDFWRSAVDSYVEGTRGSEVIYSIVRLIEPRPAMERCYQIYKSVANLEKRIYALTLLVAAANYAMIPWIDEFLADPNEDINVVGTWFLDQLLMRNTSDTPEAFGRLLQRAETHASKRVRDQVEELRIRERFMARLE